MKDENFTAKTKIIQETFNDTRRIKCSIPKENLDLDDEAYEYGEIFETEDGELIYFEVQIRDFDEAELTKFAGLAEKLYKIHQKKVSIYLLCKENIRVLVRECEIKSRADFNIRLACVIEDRCKVTLNRIKNKLKSGQLLDNEDVKALEMLPVMCDEREIDYYRFEYLKIINRFHY